MFGQLTSTHTKIARAGQIALGLLWLTDGALQFQPYMFGKSFVTGVILPASQGQPGVVGGPIVWISNLLEPRVALFNAGAATLQVLIGLGLLHRPTVKLSLLVSFAWAACIWFAGEGLGMIFTGTASPLTGAPGAALLYPLAGLICWPPSGPNGHDGRRAVAWWCWSAIWLGSAALWLTPTNSSAASIHDWIAAAPAGAGWLTGVLSTVAHAASGRGTTIALALSIVSVGIGISLPFRWHTRFFLGLAIVISVGYWIFGQGLGGIFTGQATDPGTAPLFILIASILLAQEHLRAPSAREHFVPATPQGAPNHGTPTTATP